MLRSPVMFTYPPNQDISETAVNQRLLPSVNDRDYLRQNPHGGNNGGGLGAESYYFSKYKARVIRTAHKSIYSVPAER